MAKGGFRFPPFAIPLKTTKKGLLPLLGFSQGFGWCKSYFNAIKNAMQMRIGQTGEVVEILCGAVGRTGASAPTGCRKHSDFHTSNIQRALT